MSHRIFFQNEVLALNIQILIRFRFSITLLDPSSGKARSPFCLPLTIKHRHD